MHAGVGALQRALLISGHEARHQAGSRRPGDAPDRHDRNADPEQRAVRRQRIDQEAERAAAIADHDRPKLAELLQRRPDQAALHDRGPQPDKRQRQTDRGLIPAIAIGGVQHEGRRQRDMRDVGAEPHHRERAERAVRAEQPHRAERVGAAPAERRAPFLGQRFRQHEEAIGGIGEAERRRHPERQPRIDAAEQTADRGPDDETDPERGADLAEHRGAFLRGRNVGDIGKRGGDAGRSDAGDHAADEQPDQRWRQRHQHVVEAKAEIGEQDHRTAAEAIGQGAQQRRCEELHQRPGGAEQTVDARRISGVVVGEAFDQFWQDRQDHPDRQHVEQDGDEDEAHRRAPRPRGWRRDDFGGRASCAHDGRLRLWANGLAFSRSVMRTGVPGSSKPLRRLLIR